MPHHAITMTDGSVAIMQTVAPATPAECVAKWPASERAKVVSVRPIGPAAIPNDRSFRNAWTLVGGNVTHDMAKARNIHRDRLRNERRPLLETLDMAYLRADETSDVAAKAAIALQKQKLRDAPAAATIDLAMTVDELKSLTLDALTK